MIHSAHAVGSTALATERVERRLAAILAADVAGYSRLIEMDEDRTLQAFKTIRIEQFEPTIAAHHGRLVKTTGDGFLVETSDYVNHLGLETDEGSERIKAAYGELRPAYGREEQLRSDEPVPP